MLKSWGWGGGGGGGGGVVAHKILVTSPEAKYLCYLFVAFLGFGLWTGTWPRACQLIIDSICFMCHLLAVWFILFMLRSGRKRRNLSSTPL